MLASIQEVLSVEPINGADRIEKLRVLGWNLVSEKGNFKKGDLCIYIEIDTIVPDKPEFEFLRKSNFRIKTVTLRGQISQGIALPLSFLPKGCYKIGDDVTDILAITHYVKPIPFGMGGLIRQAYLPFNVPQTDERMLQSIPDILKDMMGRIVYVSTKLDGTSATFCIRGNEYHVCSRGNSWIEDEKNVYWRISKKLKLYEKLLSFKKNYAIQGELCGPGIQKNPLQLKDHELFIFNLFDIDEHKYLGFPDLENFCKDCELQMVPVEMMLEIQPNYNVETFINLSKGNYPSGRKKEGIVVRTIHEGSSTTFGRLSFKVINNSYED